MMERVGVVGGGAGQGTEGKWMQTGMWKGLWTKGYREGDEGKGMWGGG